MDQNNPNFGMQPVAPVMTVGNWVVTFLVMLIPVVNIVMLILWAAGSSGNPNRKTWAITILIFWAILIVIWIAWLLLFGGTMLGMMSALT